MLQADLQAVSGQVKLQRAQSHTAKQCALSSTEMTLPGVLVVIDRDPGVRSVIASHLAYFEHPTRGYGTGKEFLQASSERPVACVVLNMELPDYCGLEFQRLFSATSNAPLIFFGRDWDLTVAMTAMKAGAIDCLVEPLQPQSLLQSVSRACQISHDRWLQAVALQHLRFNYRLLSPREREVLPMVVGGLLNKQAAALLGISEVTLQIHRSHVLRKMKAGSVASLVRMADALGITPWTRAAPPDWAVGQSCVSAPSRRYELPLVSV